MNTDLEITLEFLDSPTEVDFFAVAGAPGHDGQDGAPGHDGADGHTPVITASKQGNTTTISVDGDPVAQILDGADGQPGRDGQDGSPGQDGADGHSPVVTASKSGKVTTVSVDGSPIATINDGNDGQDGQDGSDGQDGQDGFSPSASVSKSGSTATITVTDKNGTTTATVSDGQDGADGQDGHTPVKGTDYWTAADKAEIVEDVTEEIDIPAVASGAQVKGGSASSAFIAPSVGDAASFYGLAKAAGDATQSASSNTVGNYTDAAKVAIQKMLGIYEPPWELLNDITLTERGQIDLTADSNGTPYNLLSVYMEVVVPANSTAESSGYGRYHFYDISGDYLTAESGKYQASTANQYKNIYVQRDSNMVRVPCTRYTSTGNNGAWVMKSLESRGGKIGFGNIIRIAINASDYEPAGTKIKIYAQRAY